jgi:hypothetical protein
MNLPRKHGLSQVLGFTSISIIEKLVLKKTKKSVFHILSKKVRTYLTVLKIKMTNQNLKT